MDNDILNKISSNEALEILRQITKTDKRLKKRIIELAEDLLRDIDVDDVCEDVFYALNGIDVHELWDHAGPKADGYTSIDDMAIEMFEEALEPFIQEMYRLLDLKMRQKAKLYCQGVLKGIIQYEEDAGSESKDWFTDVPGEILVYILNKWKKHSNDDDKKEMKDFIRHEYSDWSEWRINQI